MLRGALALLLLAAPMAAGGDAGAPRIPDRPVRVMSINQCTDQLVLMLLPPARIASVTWLSRDPRLSLMAQRAGQVAVNHGEIEDVVRQRPDLVVADTFGSPALRASLKRFGYPMVEVAQPQSIDEIRASVRTLAAALGERSRGEALIAGMDARLARLAALPALDRRIASWSGDGLSSGEGSLYDAVLGSAGARNIAAEGRVRGSDVEALLAADPDLLVEPVGGTVGASLRDHVARHPVVRQRWAGRVVGIAPRDYICGTPLIADAALRLRRSIEAARR